MALDLDTARAIVDAVCGDLTARRNIENYRPLQSLPPPLVDPPMGFAPPKFLDSALERLHWAGAVRNATMLLMGSGPEDDAFRDLTCVGIAIATKAAIMGYVFNGKLPRVLSSYMAERTVNGTAHKGTGIAMKDGTEYVFDWWPTLNLRNPLISSRAVWRVAGKSVEYTAFKGLP